MPTLSQPAGRSFNELKVNNGETHKFSSGMYTMNKLTCEPGSTVTVDAKKGQVVIFVKEAVSLNGAKFNIDGDPGNVTIYGLHDEKTNKACKVEVTNGSAGGFLFQGLQSDVEICKGSTFSGSVIGKRVRIFDNTTVTFPSSLAETANKPIILSWEEL